MLYSSPVMKSDFKTLSEALDKIETTRAGKTPDYKVLAGVIREGITEQMEDDIRFTVDVMKALYGNWAAGGALKATHAPRNGVHVKIKFDFNPKGGSFILSLKDGKGETHFSESRLYITSGNAANRLCSQIRANGLDFESSLEGLRKAFATLAEKAAKLAEKTMNDAVGKLELVEPDRVLPEDIEARRLLVWKAVKDLREALIEKTVYKTTNWFSRFQNENYENLCELATLVDRAREDLGCLSAETLYFFDRTHGVDRVSETTISGGVNYTLSLDFGICIDSNGETYRPLRLILTVAVPDTPPFRFVQELGMGAPHLTTLRDFVTGLREKTVPVFHEFLPELGNNLLHRLVLVREQLARDIEAAL